MRIKLIASIVTTAMLLLCGCKSGIDNENSHIQMSNAAQQIEQKTESNNKEESAIIDDGVYRTYSLGETFPAGAILDLNSSLLLRTAETPVKTAIYYNGELYKTIEFSEQNEEVELDYDGNYWIVVIDKENNFTDITNEIDYLVPSRGDSVLFLQ